MSYNTIKLRPEDLDRRPAFYNKFVHGSIKPEELRELKRILENERYLAIEEGNLSVLFSTTAMLDKISYYMKEKGISPIDIQISRSLDR
jgi:hypothetical protein